MAAARSDTPAESTPAPRASSAGFKYVRWAAQEAPTVRRSDGNADTVAHLVLLCLAVYADKDGRARPGVTTLADDARLSTRATSEALTRLEAAGLIGRLMELNGGTVVWRLHEAVRRGEDERIEALQARESARRKHAERSRRHRARKAERDAEVERDVTPVQGVTNRGTVTPHLDARDAGPQRTRRSTSTHVTPSRTSQPQVTPATTAMNYQELPGEGTRAPAHAPAREDPPPLRCPKHIENDTDQPCRACGEARRANQRWHADQEARRLELAAALDAARADPRMRCEHGTDGGRYVRPDTGTSPCALCRRANPQEPT